MYAIQAGNRGPGQSIGSDVRLVDLLVRDRIVVPLAGRTLREAVAELAATMISSGIATDPAELERVVGEAVPAEVVPVGPHASLVQCRTDAVRELAVSLGVSRKALQRRRASSTDARILVLIAAPRRDVSNYLQAAGGLAQAVGLADVAQGLIDARTPDDVLALPALNAIRLPGYLTVRDVMGGRVISVAADTSLVEAIRLMITHGIPAIPVVAEGGAVVGMVSYRELLRYLLPNYVKRVSGGYPAVPRPSMKALSNPESLAVREVMDRSVLCVSEDQTLADVANMMVNKDVDRFPVVREGALVGFLTRGDIVRRLFAP